MKMLAIRKEEINKSLEEADENTSRQWYEMKKAAQDLRVEIGSIKKKQMDGKLGMKN